MNIVTILKNYILLAIIGLLVGCSPQINYMGKHYNPTKHIDLFFDQADIKEDYNVMGVMKNEGGSLEMDDVESIQEAMVKKAKEVGADGILFIGFYSLKQNGEDVYRSKEDDFELETHHTNTSKQYTVKLLKYK